MAIAIPVFPQFDADSDKTTAGARWDRWIGRLENLFIVLKLVVADDANQGAAKLIDDRKRALLLHYVGERTYDLYEAQTGDTKLTYNGTKRYCQIILNQERTLKWKFIRSVAVNKKTVNR